VQHAHRKAIIHRDLKPSNILVTMEDGKSIPKIIDFGLAKAMGHRLTDKSLFTELGVIVGTPAYMSPEQADLTDHEVDTRTDVYSLGLILYELLAGALPHDAKRFRNMPFDEILRTIKEVEAPRPSSKIHRLGDSSAAVAASRRTEPRLLARQLSGDLDRIILKALEKSPARRYGSVAEFAADINRYLRHEPVLAISAGVSYRARRFVRRHRFGVGVAAGLVVLLVGFAITMTIQAKHIAAERDRANRQAEVSRRVTDFLIGLYKVSDPGEARGRTITAREVLDTGAKQIETQLRNDPEIQAQLMHAMGIVYWNLGLDGQAQSLLQQAAELRTRVLGPEHLDTLTSSNALAVVYRRQSRFQESEKLNRATLTILQRTVGPDHLETIKSRVYLARLLIEAGRSAKAAEAADLLRDAVERSRRTLGADHELSLQSTMYLAMADNDLGRLSEAEPLFRSVVEGRRRVLGEEHPDTLSAETDLALNLEGQKQYKQAEKLYEAALLVERRILSPDHPSLITTMMGLGRIYMEEHRFAEAEKTFQETFSRSRRSMGESHPYTLNALYNLACKSALEAKRDEALARLRVAIDHGYAADQWMQQDEDLQSLHGDPRFDALVARARAVRQRNGG